MAARRWRAPGDRRPPAARCRSASSTRPPARRRPSGARTWSRPGSSCRGSPGSSARSPSPATSASAPPPTPSRRPCGSRTSCRTCWARACCRRRSSPCTPGSLDEDERGGQPAGRRGRRAPAAPSWRRVVVVGMLLARPLTVVLTPGLRGERLDLAVTLLRIMFPGIGFLVLSAWCLGILNSHRRFFLSYVAPVMWNVAQIAFVVAAGVWGATEEGIATRARLGRGRRRDAPARRPGPDRPGPDARRCGCRLDIAVRRRAGRDAPVRPRGRRPRRRSSSSPTSTSSWPASWPSAPCRRSPTPRCSTCSRSACSAWPWRPPSCRSCRASAAAGAAAIRDRLHVGHRAHHVLRRAHRRAVRVRGRRHHRRAPPAGRVRRRRHAARLVRAGRLLARAPRHHPIRACSRTASTPSTAPSWWRASRCSASRWPGCSAPSSCSRFDRFAIVAGRSPSGSTTSRFRPAPRRAAAGRERPAPARDRRAWPSAPRCRRGSSTACCRARSSGGSARSRRSATTPAGASSPPAAAACWPPASGPVTDDLPAAGRRGRRSCVPTGRSSTSLITAVDAGAGGDPTSCDRLRRLLAGRRGRDSVRLAAMFKALKRWWKYLGAKVNSAFNAKADPKIQLEQAITEAQDQHRRLAGAGRQRHRQPEADRDAPRPGHGGAREGLGQRPAGRAHGRRGRQEGRHRQGRGVHVRRRVVRHPAHRHRERGRGPQAARPAVLPGLRPGQGGRAAERHRPAAQAGRAQQAPVPARPGQDAGAGQQGHGLAVGDRRRGRPHLRRGAGQDRGPLRQGQGHVRAHRVVGGVPDARGRAGGRQQRGPDPPRPDPGPARAERRPATEARRGRSRPPPPRPLPARPAAPERDATSTGGRRGRRGGRPRGACPRGARACGGRPRPAGRRSRGARAPWRTPCRRARRSRRRRRSRSCPSRVATPAGSSDTPRSSSARRAPSSTTIVPLDPTAKAIQSLRAGRRLAFGCTTVPTPGPSVDRPPPARHRATPGRSPPARRTTRRSWRRPASRPCPRCPRADPVPPASDSSEWSTSTISSISDADESRRGSAVRSPGASVRSTSRSAASRWATSAARRSLSPKRISSSAMASFSLTTGMTPRSRRRPSVARAWRYCWRIVKSRGARSTWPLTSPWVASALSYTRISRVWPTAEAAWRVTASPRSTSARVAQRRQPRRDRPRGHEHHPVSLGSERGGLGAELRHGGFVDLAVGVGDRRRADLGDDDHWSSS